MDQKAVTPVPKRHGQGSAEDRPLWSVTSWQRDTGLGHFWTTFSPAPRFLQVRQRRGAEIRTDASAPLMTGLPLTGMCWLDSPARRCHGFFEARHRNHAKSTGILAVAQEPSVISIPYSPNILSAFRWQSRRQVLPSLILGDGEPCWQDSWPHRAAGNNRTSLRSTRTLPPLVGNQPSFRRTHRTLPGAAGVDSKTGAAIHRPVAPGESA